MAKIFTYSIENSTLNGILDQPSLILAISNSEIASILVKINTLGDDLEIHFLTDLSAGDIVILDGLVSGHSGTAIGEEESKPVYFGSSNVLTSDGRLRIVSEKTDLSKIEYYTVDWTDPTTWYPKATRHVNVIALNSGDFITYDLVGHANLIDTFHGKINQEDFLIDSEGYLYRVIVKVDGVTKEEKDPHTDVGDFVVNYEDGEIVFESAQNTLHVVTATFHKATSSLYEVIPPDGKNVLIELIEAQFGSDMGMEDSLVFQVVGPVEIFAPALVDNPYPSGTLIPLQNPLVYKTIKNFLTDCYKSHPAYPPMSTSTWRGTQNSTIVFDWDYLGVTKIQSSLGMRIHVFLQNDIPFSGEFATASFYCTLD